MRFQALRFAVHKVNFTSYVIAPATGGNLQNRQAKGDFSTKHNQTLHAITYKASLRMPWRYFIAAMFKSCCSFDIFYYGDISFRVFSTIFTDGNNDLVALLYSDICIYIRLCGPI